MMALGSDLPDRIPPSQFARVQRTRFLSRFSTRVHSQIQAHLFPSLLLFISLSAASLHNHCAHAKIDDRFCLRFGRLPWLAPSLAPPLTVMVPKASSPLQLSVNSPVTLAHPPHQVMSPSCSGTRANSVPHHPAHPPSYGLPAGIAAGCTISPCLRLVGQWFEESRSTAMGVAFGGAGLGVPQHRAVFSKIFSDFVLFHPFFIKPIFSASKYNTPQASHFFMLSIFFRVIYLKKISLSQK